MSPIFFQHIKVCGKIKVWSFEIKRSNWGPFIAEYECTFVKIVGASDRPEGCGQKT